MKQRIFVLRHYIFGIPTGFQTTFCLHKPGRAGFSPLEVCQCGVATPYRAFLFLPLTRHHHAHRNSHPYRTGRTQPAGYPGPLSRTRRRNGAAGSGNSPRIVATAKTPGNPAPETGHLIAHTHQGFIFLLTACAVWARGNTLLPWEYNLKKLILRILSGKVFQAARYNNAVSRFRMPFITDK